MEEKAEITRLLAETSEGSRDAVDRLLPVVYEELRGLAASFLGRERAGHTLQATALAHEAYLRPIDQRQVNWQNRAHFFAVAAQASRRILTDHARRRGAAKRGGEAARVSLDDVATVGADGPGTDLVALDLALSRLAEEDPQSARLVEMRFYAGLTIEEIAEVLGVTDRTVRRHWTYARAWLFRELDGGGEAG